MLKVGHEKHGVLSKIGYAAGFTIGGFLIGAATVYFLQPGKAAEVGGKINRLASRAWALWPKHDEEPEESALQRMEDEGGAMNPTRTSEDRERPFHA
jgi:hypothetical protein